MTIAYKSIVGKRPTIKTTGMGTHGGHGHIGTADIGHKGFCRFYE